MKRLSKTVLFFTLIISFNNLFSQYTEIINSNRPGYSSGAFSVGKNILQIESGLYFMNETHELRQNKVKGLGADFKIRYGLIHEKLEFIIDGVFQADEFEDMRYNPNYEYNRRNFKKLKFGAKYLVFDPKKGEEDKPNLYSYWANRKFKLKNLIPSISAYLGINFDTKNNPYTAYNVKGISPTLGIYTQSNITRRSVIITNLLLQRIGSSQNDFEFIICMTYAFNQKFIGYIETNGIKSDFYAENNLSIGLAHLLNKELQIDLGSTINFKNTPKIFYLNLGVSYRLKLPNNS